MSWREDRKRESEWLAELKPGDEVAYSIDGWGPPVWDFMTVARRTKTQIIESNGRRFRSADGRAIGGRSGRISEATPEKRESAAKRPIINSLCAKHFSRESLDGLPLAELAALAQTIGPYLR